MKATYPIQWVPASTEYILACIQEEWRQCAVAEEDPEMERQVPTFTTTVHEWREAMDLLPWSQLSRALDRQWGTHFSADEWYSVLEPARDRTLRGVCELLATQARSSVVPSARLMGHDCPAAGLFLAIRSLLIRAGAPVDLRPSTPLRQYVEKWPKVFLDEIARLAPGGLPFGTTHDVFGAMMVLGQVLGGLLLVISCFTKQPAPALIILTVAIIAFFGLGGWLGRHWYCGRPTLRNVKTFRALTEMILQQRRFAEGDESKMTAGKQVRT